VEGRLRAAIHCALILDFDGTLVPVIDNPHEVRLDPSLRRVLRRMAQHPGASVYIMSGRSLADLRRQVRVPRVHLLGLHGWEKRGAKLPPEQVELLLQAKLWLAHWLPPLTGIKVEDKGGILAVHYRGARLPEVRFAEHVMQMAGHEFRPGLRLLKGKKIWELLPSAIPGKGPITRHLLEGMPADTLPIIIGDDDSDESAFAALPHALAVRVGGEARTSAQFFLRDPDAVREFLERLEAVIACKPIHPHSNS
jgi:trehalose 6-phosphate phosphatase